MRKKVISVLLALSLPLISMADSAEQKGPGASPNGQGIDRMAKDLGLNEEQKDKVEGIFKAEKEKVEAIFKERDEKLKAIQEETRASLESVLTPEQMAKLKKKMSQQQRRKK